MSKRAEMAATLALEILSSCLLAILGSTSFVGLLWVLWVVLFYFVFLL